jgi:aryl-alcohol dehydrogenase-like predicted oxidoreductase
MWQRSAPVPEQRCRSPAVPTPSSSWGATIAGATTMAQLKEDIAAAQRPLDGETLSEIAALQVRYPNPAG